MPFQTQVGVQPAPAVAGDFASTNPRWTVLAGAGGLVAGPNGLYVGRFAWTTPPLDPDNSPSFANNYGAGPVAGFVHREQQALFTQYLQETSMLVPAGFPVTLFSGGDFWVVNSGSAEATIGMKAYANFATGLVTFAATGNPTQSASATGVIAAETFSVTGSISGNLLTVTAVGSGTVVPGATISGSGIASGTMIVSQASGTAGGIGTYYVNIPEQNVASTTVSGTYGQLTVSGTVTGAYVVGGVLSGTGVVAGTTISALGTGTGGDGTYIVNNNTAVSSTTITQVGNVETKWIAMSAGAAGELIKISQQALG